MKQSIQGKAEAVAGCAYAATLVFLGESFVVRQLAVVPAAIGFLATYTILCWNPRLMVSNKAGEVL